MLFLFLVSLATLVICLVLPFATSGVSLEEVLPFAELSLLTTIGLGVALVRRRRMPQKAAKRGAGMLSFGLFVALLALVTTIGSVVATVDIQDRKTRAEQRLAEGRKNNDEDEIYYADASLEDAESLLPFGLAATTGSGIIFLLGTVTAALGLRRVRARR